MLPKHGERALCCTAKAPASPPAVAARRHAVRAAMRGSQRSLLTPEAGTSAVHRATSSRRQPTKNILVKILCQALHTQVRHRVGVFHQSPPKSTSLCLWGHAQVHTTTSAVVPKRSATHAHTCAQCTRKGMVLRYCAAHVHLPSVLVSRAGCTPGRLRCLWCGCHSNALCCRRTGRSTGYGGGLCAAAAGVPWFCRACSSPGSYASAVVGGSCVLLLHTAQHPLLLQYL